MIVGTMIVGAMRLSLLSSGGERRLAEANEKSDNEGRSRTSPFVPARRCWYCPAGANEKGDDEGKFAVKLSLISRPRSINTPAADYLY